MELLDQFMKKSHPALTERLIQADHMNAEPFNINEWWLVARLEQYQPAKFEEYDTSYYTRTLLRVD